MGPGADARSRLISATEAGRAKHAEAQRAWKQAQLALNARLGDARVARLHEMIDACMADLDTEDHRHESTPARGARVCRRWLWVLLAAAGTFALTMGARQSMGLFVNTLNTHTGVGLAGVSLAFAFGQFWWGLTQPRGRHRRRPRSVPGACWSSA